MEKQLTNDEILKVFAMSLPCDCIVNVPYGSIDNPIEMVTAKLIGLVGDIGHFQCFDLFGEPWSNILTQHITTARMHKIPLSKISDEDAIEVARLSGETSVKMGKQALFEIYNHAYNIKGIEWHFTFQYLISKGYAVPLFFAPNHWANGKTAIELNIAIEKSTC